MAKIDFYKMRKHSNSEAEKKEKPLFLGSAIENKKNIILVRIIIILKLFSRLFC